MIVFFKEFPAQRPQGSEDSYVTVAHGISGFASDWLTFPPIQQDHVRMAFSGDKTLIPLLKALAEIYSPWWEDFSICLVEEQVVDKDHAQSSARLIEEYFLKRCRANFSVPLPFTPLVCDATLPPEAILQEALFQYQQPDVALLGMGADGRIASLFPDAPEYEHALSATDPLVLTTPTHAPFKCLGMSLSALENCKSIFLFASGEDKGAVLDLAKKGINPQLPISYILHSEKVECFVFCIR
ncbi:6-phosphogluconolactonase [Helicobacter baculiformis]|uniref:6-phosphogluconolactonase n=1 Tax=Helicobacter baculiformis TaxID=427351 RepID=A0ABV7ZIZ0_9HELI|nr:6-phosphogluconolactonase [Helicobacter baculiformis]